MERVVEEAPAATWVLMPFAAGLLLGGLHSLAPGWAALLVAAALLATKRGRRPSIRTITAAIAAGVACGAFSAALARWPPAPDDVSRFVGPRISAIEGTIARSESGGGRASLTIRVERVANRRRTGDASGLLGVTIAHTRREWPVGARVRLVGQLRRPRNFGNPGGYDLERALGRRGIRVTTFLWDDARIDLVTASGGEPWSEALRAALLRDVAQHGDRAVHAYLAAVLLGAARGMDDEIRTALTRTGLSHVVSVSGFHVAVAAGAWFVAVRWLALRLGTLALRLDVAKLAAVTGLVPVAAYAALAGGSVPATRSFLMYGAVLLALAVERAPDVLRTLAAAAVLLAARTPDAAGDVSFQLSFVAVAALVVVARARVPRAGGAAAPTPLAWVSRVVVDALRTSLAATVATAPLTAWHFQQVSLIAPIANLVALPLLGPMTLVPGLVALPVLAVAPSLGHGLLGFAAWAAGLGLDLARALARVPWAAVETPMPSLVELALAYAALTLWWLRPFAKQRVAWALLATFTLADVGYWGWERFGNDSLRVTFLSVGQGDAAVVELPRGGVIVIDGGGFAGDFDPGARLIAPFLRSRKILRLDAIALSHPQLDHYGGLAHLVEHFAPREFWSNGARSDAARFATLVDALRVAGTRSVVLAAGTRWRLGADTVLEVVHPGRGAGLGVNDASLVLRLRHGATSVLFTGDVERVAEEQMVARGAALASDVLKVPHHGSRTSTTARWLAAVDPTIAIVSSGAGNRFGFPAPEVVRRLHASGARVWNTAESGAVRVVSDGRRVAVTAANDVVARKRFVFPTSLW